MYKRYRDLRNGGAGRRIGQVFGTLVVVVLSAVPTLQEATAQGLQRTQTIPLKKGWNAVYLEVEPAQFEPAELFGGTPVDIVATYFASGAATQFVSNPDVDLFKNLGWAVWYAGDRPDAFLTTLDAIYGRRAYLLHTTSDHQWSVTGNALIGEVVWQADSFNFVGFPVAAPGAPSFTEFFVGSKAHQHNKIYRLTDGAWRRVTDPGAEAMRSGEAFWIFCEGASKYSGPVSVQTRFRKGLLLLDGSTDKLILRNHTDHPVSASVEHVAGTGDAVPLSLMVRVLGEPSAHIKMVGASKPAGTWIQQLPPIEAGKAIALPFTARRKEMAKEAHQSLLKITTDLGTEAWVPVSGYRSDLEQSD